MPETKVPTALTELRGWPHWVVWRAEKRNEKPTKVPYQATRPSRPASSTDPATWGRYEDARAVVEAGRADGVGYVFSESDEYTGVDLDNCIVPAQGAFARALGPTIVEPARRIIAELDSYTELSPTGTGLHVIVRGAVKGTRNRTGKTPWGGEFEVYDHARFFTITGEHLTGTPEKIEARQAELDRLTAELFSSTEQRVNGKPAAFLAPAATLDDAQVVEKIRTSKQGGRFAELFDRGAPEGQESESDLALCNILAFWLGPHPERIDAWFRRSALMREKWDEKRGTTTYGGYTIDRALEGRTEFYGQKAPTPTPQRAKDDNPERPYAEEISHLFGLIDDPVVSGWRSSRKATCRVLFTTRSGAELDLDNWKAATGTPNTLAQEIGVQLGVEVTLKREDIKRLNVLMGRFCALVEATTVRDRARQLGVEYLQAAETLPFDMNDQASRWSAFKQLQSINPKKRAREENIDLGAAGVVLYDVTGRRYVRIQWMVDFVKEHAVPGTAGTLIEHLQEPGGWTRVGNAKGQVKASEPGGSGCVWQSFYEVPAGWEDSLA